MAPLPSARVARRAGRGDPLVLIHGLGTDSRVWQPLLDVLTRRRRVLALDLPGLGSGPGREEGPEPPTPERMADAVQACLDREGLERPDVVGSSLGGMIGLDLARRGRARRVVAIAPLGQAGLLERLYAASGIARAHGVARILGRLRGALAALPPGRALLLMGGRSRPWAVSRRDAAGELDALAEAPTLRPALRELVRAGAADWLAEVRAPVLLLWGAADRLLPAWQARRFAERLPDARLRLLPFAGHLPMSDAPTTVARLTLAHLEA